jgi:hypothetical protein
MPSVLTKEESKELLALCRPGRLYEVEDWIRAGEPLRIHAFLDNPAMRQHLAGQERQLAQLGFECPDTGATLSATNRAAAPVAVQPSPRVPYRLLARFDREKLYELVWSQPMWKLAPEYGVSDVALAKTCRKLQIPVPGRGYWAKAAARNHTESRPPLPPGPSSQK